MNTKLLALLIFVPSFALADTYQTTVWDGSTTITMNRLNNIETGIQAGVVGHYSNLLVVGGFSDSSQITLTADVLGVTTGTTKTALEGVSIVLDPMPSTIGLLGQDTTFSPANGQVYGCWVISKEDGTISGVISESVTAPDLSNATFSGYLNTALFSTCRNEAGGSWNIREYRQWGSYAHLNVAAQFVLSASTGNQSIDISSYVNKDVTSAIRVVMRQSISSSAVQLAQLQIQVYGNAIVFDTILTRTAGNSVPFYGYYTFDYPTTDSTFYYSPSISGGTYSFSGSILGWYIDQLRK